VADLLTEMAVVIAERDELKAELQKFASLEVMSVEDAKVALDLKGKLVGVFAAAMADEFRQAGGINFVEFDILSKDLGPLTLLMQRKEGKTPAEMHDEADARIKELEAKLEEVSCGQS
jgi:hypothetical protein